MEQHPLQYLFLSYHLSLMAKVRGFNEPCFAAYDKENGNSFYYTFDLMRFTDNTTKRITLAPTYQQVFDWLLREHGIWITVEHYTHSEPTDKLPTGFAFYIEVWGHCEYGKDRSVENGYFKTHYEAYNKAIEEALKLIEKE